MDRGVRDPRRTGRITGEGKVARFRRAAGLSAGIALIGILALASPGCSSQSGSAEGAAGTASTEGMPKMPPGTVNLADQARQNGLANKYVQQAQMEEARMKARIAAQKGQQH